MISVPTTVLLTALTCGICAGALLLQRNAGALGPARLAWAGGFAAVGLGWGLYALRGGLDALVTLGVANVLLLGGYALFVPGFDVVAQMRPRWGIVPLVGVATACVMLATLVFELGQPVHRVPFLSAISIGVSGLLLERLVRPLPARFRVPARVAAGCAAVLILAEAIRIAVWARGGHDFFVLEQRSVLWASWIAYLAASMALGFTCLRLLTLGESADLERRATRDPLTGVANRALFLDTLEQTLQQSARYGRPTSLIVCDIDHFKTVNDTLGHAAGDRCLREISQALTGVVRGADLVGRLGGDEFAVLCPETDADGAWQLADRIRGAIEERVSDRARDASASLGIAVHLPQDTPTSLLHRADQALYRAKDTGRNRVAVAS